MAKNNIKKPSKGPSARTKLPHRFVGMREPLFVNAPAKQVANMITTSSGAAALPLILHSSGLKASVLTSGVFGAAAQIDPVHMPWLFSQANNFKMYRVTRAVLIFSGNTGSTSSGQLSIFTSSDANDLSVSDGLQVAYSMGSGTKTFDLANSSSRELRVQMDIDSSWKKVSSVLSTPGNTVGYPVGSTGQIVQVNSVNDLSFGSAFVQVQGGPASTTVGTLFIEYDVEFKNPISANLNV